MHGAKRGPVILLLICALVMLPSGMAAAMEASPEDGMPSPPATYYGEVRAAPGFIPATGLPVTAFIDGHVCGQSSTTEQGGSIVYSVDVVGEGPGGVDGCGAPDRTVVLRIASQYMAPVAPWDTTSLHYLPLQPMQPPVAPAVSIERSGETLVLSWPPVTLDIADHATLVHSYRIWRGLQPYFDPAQPDCGCSLIAETAALAHTDAGSDGVDVVGDVAHNYTYIVKAVNAAGESTASNRASEFDFALTPGGY
jgi:hypothetical protein